MPLHCVRGTTAMNLDACKKCPYFISLKADEIMCGYRNQVTYRIIGRSEKNLEYAVMGCPRTSSNSLTPLPVQEEKNSSFRKI